MKKFLAIALAVVMILALGVPAFAADDTTHKLTIDPTNDNTAHTYEAYQVFSGKLDGTPTNGSGKLDTIAWGDGVDGPAILAALKTSADLKTDDAFDFASCDDASDVAAVLATYANDSAKLKAVADIISAHLVTAKAHEGTGDAGAAVEITGLPDGYYFVKDKANSQTGEYGTYSDFMLYVVGDTSVTAKDTTITLEKEIEDGEGEGVKTTNGSIGDNVPFKLTSTVPDMDAYNAYKFEITDTMSKGLTFNDDVTVKIGTTTLNRVFKGSDNKFYATAEAAEAMAADTNVTEGFTVESTTNNETGVTTLKIYVVNFIQYKTQKGADIEVKYSATINQDAVITGDDGNTGNVNTAKLTYSNNPNETGKGENGEPVGPEGVTPESKVTVYTTGLELLKVDGQNTNKNLEGAVFELTGESKNVVITQGEIFVRDDDNGTYWRLTDGTYTTTDPATPNLDLSKYENTAQKYKKVTTIDKTYNATNVKSEATAVTGSNGLITFAGLGEGLYTLTEKVAPVGYNLLDKPVYIFVKFVPGENGADGKFETYKYTGSDNPPAAPEGTPSSDWTLLTDNGNSSQVEFDLQVENNSGSTLPSTGGIGTTIFYVLGGLLVVFAGVLLITKTRMSKEQ